jgi:hypothetical protein
MRTIESMDARYRAATFISAVLYDYLLIVSAYVKRETGKVPNSTPKGVEICVLTFATKKAFDFFRGSKSVSRLLQGQLIRIVVE